MLTHKLSSRNALRKLRNEGQSGDRAKGVWVIWTEGGFLESSEEGFFMRAVTMVCFCESGSIPDCSHALQTAAMTGVTPATSASYQSVEASSVTS